MADQNDAPAEHVHGEMNIRHHERTFDGFIQFVVWGAALSILALIFMALVNS